MLSEYPLPLSEKSYATQFAKLAFEGCLGLVLQPQQNIFFKQGRKEKVFFSHQTIS